MKNYQKIDSNTKIYASFSGQPGRFGATVFNELFFRYDINALYIPRYAVSADIVVDIIRKFKIFGAAVSSPMKQSIVKLLDDVDGFAKQLNSVNTVINSNDKLVGYNTDAHGFLKSLEPINKISNINSLVIVGTGGVLNSLLWASKELGLKSIYLVSRNKVELEKFKNNTFIRIIDSPTEIKQIDLLVNATLNVTDKAHIIWPFVEKTKNILDLNFSTVQSDFEIEVKKRGIKFQNGLRMAKYQLMSQFFLYTGIKVEIEEIDEIVSSIYLNL